MKNEKELFKVKYLSLENGGVELGDPIGYIFLLSRDSVYMELISCFSDIPVLKRVPLSNTTKDGEEYGSKMVVAGNECYLASGACYVLSDIDLKEIFGKQIVDQETIKDYILASDKFFVDRKTIAKERMKSDPIRMTKILAKDKKYEERYDKFFEERGVQLQKK